MNALRTSLSVAAASVLAASSALALNPVTNWSTGTSPTDQFNSNAGYGPVGSSLDGAPTNAPVADQWQTTDPFNVGTGQGSTSLMAFIPNYTALTAGTGNQSVYFGGYDLANGVLPGITTPSLYRTFSTLLTDSSESVSFISDFAIRGPSSTIDPAWPSDDTFGFSFFNFPGTTSLGNVRFSQNALTNLDIFVNGAAQSYEIGYNSLYRLTATFSNTTFSLNIAGLLAQTNGSGVVTNYSIVTNQTVFNGAILNALSASAFEYASIDWLLAGSTNSPGANYMIINSAEVVSQVIPEPGTWAAAALLLAGATWVVRRRRVAA